MVLPARVVISGATASDGRAHSDRLCIYAAFRRVIDGSNPRDGLLERPATPALQEVQCLSPNDSRKGSNSRALTALLESWVNDSRDKRSPGGAQSRRRVSAVQRWRAADQLHKTGVVPRAQFNPRGRYGATGEQKHLPDMPTPLQSSRKDWTD